MANVEGYIEQIIFRNDENGYTVFILASEGDEITCVGVMGQINIGEYIEANADMMHHPTYGEQYKVSQYISTMPKDIKAIEKYLGSGIIKGIGPSLAKKIVKHFKKETFNIIENEPLRLSEIKGISEKKAQQIAEIFDEKKEMRQAMIFLQEFNISTTYAIKIFQKYGDKLYNIIKTNPYQLAEDITGIGFQIADEIAYKVGIATNSRYRVKSAIDYILVQASLEGHTYLPKIILIEKAISILQVSEELIENVLVDMQVNKQIIQKKSQNDIYVYNTRFYYMELCIAKKLFDLNMKYEIKDNYFSEQVRRIEEEIEIELDEVQKQAIREAVINGVFVITGGPGTGKTTTINLIIKYFEEEGLEIILAAPTGRAAKRMTEATGYEAKTIHRLLEVKFKSEDNDERNSKLGFEKNEDNPIEADVIIIDEMSMVDVTIMHYLLKAISPGTRLIMVGDVNQLPSVGPGNVLKDIISANKTNLVKLTHIFRQASQSAIVINAHKINLGQPIELKNNTKDFFYIKKLSSNDIINEMTTLIKTRLPNFTGYNVFDGLQILTPMRKGTLGVEELNTIIQNIVNPNDKSKKEKEFRNTIFREGDKVMQIKNNYQLVWEIKNQYGYIVDEGLGVFNGDIGIIKSINQYTEQVTILFDDERQVKYEYNQLEEIEHAYAITIHKSQGSEYPVVILPLLSGPSMLLNRNLLYTAVTRAKEYVIILGNDETVQLMIKNERETKRFSSLGIRINEIAGTIQ